MTKNLHLTNSDSQDNRNCPRTDDDCDVFIYKESLMIKAHCKNLSENGIYLTTDGLLFPKNSQVKLVFADDSDKEHTVVGKVVHRTMQGIGVAFKNTRH